MLTLSEKVTECGPLPLTAVGEIKAGAGNGSGQVWLADEPTGTSVTRVDQCQASTGLYTGHELIEEKGVSALGFGVGVGRFAGEEHVYVGAAKNERSVVGVYDSSSDKLRSVWEGTNTQNKSFSETEGKKQAGEVRGVAVDESGSPQTGGDVYVATRGLTGFPAFNVVDVFAGQADGQEPESTVGGSGMGELRGTCPSAGKGAMCTSAEQVEHPFANLLAVAISSVNSNIVVLDSEVKECGNEEIECDAVDVFAPVAEVPGAYSFLFAIKEANGVPLVIASKVAVDASTGNIYVLEKNLQVVDEFNGEGGYLGQLKGTAPEGPRGPLAPFKAIKSVAVENGEVFVGDVNRELEVGVADVFGPNLTIPDVTAEPPVLEITPHSGVLMGAVNPDNAGGVTCEFEYGTSTRYGQRTPCTEPVANTNQSVSVHALAEGLSPDTTYDYRLDASNSNPIVDTGECPRDCGQFATSGPGIAGESVLEVAETSATLAATVTPNNAPTSYFFEYGKSSEYETSIPLTSASLGSEGQELPVSQHIQGLSPNTLYHYRIVVESELQRGKTETFTGPEQAFTTQAVLSGLVLPDNRRWELVSPPDKHGATLVPIEESAVTQSSASGSLITYAANASTEQSPPGYFELVQVISTRGENGWTSKDISLPHSSATSVSSSGGSEYRFFSQDVSRGLVQPFGPFTSLAGEVFPPDSETTPYIRHDDTCVTQPTTCYEPLVTDTLVPPGTHFGGALRFVGASADLEHAVLVSSRFDEKTHRVEGVLLHEPPNPGETSEEPLYEWSAGAPVGERLLTVSVLPEREGGELEPGKTRLGDGSEARDAVSGDGSRVVWSVVGGHLYVRDMVLGQTVRVDMAEAACKTCGLGVPDPVFQVASGDGLLVFFTDTQRLTENAGVVPGQADLYVCEVVVEAGQLGCVLSDLTPEVGGEAGTVQGLVLGISDDGSWVYFVANGALSADAPKGACRGDDPQVGAVCGLYVVHRGEPGWEAPRLVGVLGGEDWPDWQGVSEPGLGSLTAQVSGNGRFVVFISDRSLTGYDSRDAVTGRPDEEVFLYDAQAAGGTGGVVCLSCDPSGARPLGVTYARLRKGIAGLQGLGLWSEDQGVAGSVPGWTGFKPQVSRYQSRYLSNEGRAFFDSSDALVPQDINGGEDVYEYEPVGVGGCGVGLSTFVGALRGCVGLISSGAGAGESGFLDASESGDDVFFLTGEQLVPADVDNAFDVYDAHVCGAGGVACVGSVEEPPVCVTVDACRAAPLPEPQVFGAPASATFSGPGDVAPASARSLSVLQKLARALKACRREKDARKRVACERVARRRYPVRASKAHKARRFASITASKNIVPEAVPEPGRL